MQNYLKSALKNLQNTYVFKHPKIAFYFWTKPFGTWKKGKTTPNQGGMVPGYLRS
jgi:hypothetical protein